MARRVRRGSSDKVVPPHRRPVGGTKNHEFVTADAAHKVGIAYRFPEPCSDHLQDFIPSLVPELVIDWLEAVKVDQYDRHR